MRVVVLALLVFGIANAATPRAVTAADANDSDFVVIVHPDNRTEAVERDFLRDAFLGKATDWHGETIRPVDLSTRFRARDRFTETVLHKTPAQLRKYRAQQIFSGKGDAPPERDSADAVIGYVLANKGAVGYLPANTDPGKAKIVRIR